MFDKSYCVQLRLLAAKWQKRTIGEQEACEAIAAADRHRSADDCCDMTCVTCNLMHVYMYCSREKSAEAKCEYGCKG